MGMQNVDAVYWLRPIILLGLFTVAICNEFSVDTEFHNERAVALLLSPYMGHGLQCT